MHRWSVSLLMMLAMSSPLAADAPPANAGAADSSHYLRALRAEAQHLSSPERRRRRT